MTIQSKEPYDVLFLLGVMRSGTTFFRNVLSANRFIQPLGSELNSFWTNVGDAPCGAVPLCLPRSEEDVTDEVAKRVFAYFDENYMRRNSPCRIIHRTYRRFRFGNGTILKGGAPFFILNKSTHLLNKIGYINALFPRAKFIFIVRDIFSHAYSLDRHFAKYTSKTPVSISLPEGPGYCWSFNPKKEGDHESYRFSDIPRYWIEQQYTALKSLQKVDNGRVLYVKFEDVVGQLDQVVERVARFLGVTDLNHDICKKLVNNTTVDPLHQWQLEMPEFQLGEVRKVIDGFHEQYAFIEKQIK